MLVERFPELENLDAEEKLILAGELWRAATQPGTAGAAPELPESSVALIEARLDDYLQNPQSGSSWETLKARILGGSNH